MAVVVGSVLSLGVASAVGPAGVLADGSVDIAADVYPVAETGAGTQYGATDLAVAPGSTLRLHLVVDAVVGSTGGANVTLRCDASGDRLIGGGIVTTGGFPAEYEFVETLDVAAGDTDCLLVFFGRSGDSDITGVSVGAGSTFVAVDPAVATPPPTPAPLCNDPAAPCYMALTGPIELVAADRARLDRTTFAIVLAAGVGITLAGALVIGLGLRRR